MPSAITVGHVLSWAIGLALISASYPRQGPESTASYIYRRLAAAQSDADCIDTRRTTNPSLEESAVSYRLDAWSQYENPEEGTEREGDIKFPPPTRKTVTRNEDSLWPNGIVRYYIHSTILENMNNVEILEKAMRTISSQTCVKFVRIFPDEHGNLPANSWVNVTGHQGGCSSDLGRSPYDSTNLNLNTKLCFKNTGHSLHELLHTLGIYHEHMRPDRDEYITILWKNIKEGSHFNFRMLDTSVVTMYGLPYDYDSIMHYSMTAFSTNRTSEATIVPTVPDVTIGQRDHLSYYDVQKINVAYGCNLPQDPNKQLHPNLNVDNQYLDELIIEDNKNSKITLTNNNDYQVIEEKNVIPRQDNNIQAFMYPPPGCYNVPFIVILYGNQ